MTAACVGRYFKVSAANITKALEHYVAENNRSQIVERPPMTYFLDAYNANPVSMRAALQNFHNWQQTPKIVVLGDMLELGPYSETEHRAMVKYVDALRFDEIHLVGEAFSAVDTPKYFRKWPNADALQAYWQQRSTEPGVTLIKGSRGIGLEKLLRFDKEEFNK